MLGLCSATELHICFALIVLIGVIQLNCHGLEGNGLSFLYTLPRSNSVLRRNQISPSIIGRLGHGTNVRL